jgi:hypothetical protein
MAVQYRARRPDAVQDITCGHGVHERWTQTYVRRSACLVLA